MIEMGITVGVHASDGAQKGIEILKIRAVDLAEACNGFNIVRRWLGVMVRLSITMAMD